MTVPDGWTNLTDSESIPDGAWTWFNGERTIVDPDGPNGPRLLVGSVAAEPPADGDINILWWDLGIDETGSFTLHENLETDDHNNPALLIRPDGRYLAMYARHGIDTYSRWRVTTNPHDPSEWGDEHTFDNGAGTTYSNVYHLPKDDGGEGRTYNFTRTHDIDPNILVSSDQGDTWAYAGKLVAREGDLKRPYLRYTSDGERIHFITTEEHPRRYENGIYHGYVEDGILHRTDGEVLDESLLDEGADHTDPSKLTTVFQPGMEFGDTVMGRAWTVDMTLNNGDPVVVFTARAGDSTLDHRFLYARWTGDEWQVHHLGKAGPGLYNSEPDYTGLAAIDPSNPERVVISTPIDPADGTESGFHHLHGGVTEDGGETWSWHAMTPGSRVDNLRPYIPDWPGEHTALVWMSGWYHTFRWWETDVIAAIDPFEQELEYHLEE